MKIPRVSFRSTAYHKVVASSVPWMRNHGRSGPSVSVIKPASTSCLRVAI